MSGAIYDKNAPQHPDCAACKQDWPIHVDGEKRYHIDVFATSEYGVMVECPTKYWPEDEDD
jgi:hypothetical protein